jgi:peptide-methionine (S)-S-oxide reductase
MMEMKKIAFAGGCFWGIEEHMSQLEGVTDTLVGYANGNLENPSYEQVCTDNTGHAETCLVTYDEGTISLESLLDRFWSIIDPTMLNQQGPDKGTQYRTGIYYLDEDDLPAIQKSKEEQQQKYNEPVVTEVAPLKSFYPAEDYHQKYLKKNPDGYCHIRLD